MGEPHDLVDSLEAFALSLPEAWLDSPWDSRVVKVRKKIFAFLSTADAEQASCTVKLPESSEHALSYPESSPTGYGLGKHGWCSLRLRPIPEDEREVLFDFVEESYRAVAPKALVRLLDSQIDGGAAPE